jgi:hypothetical protein
MTSRLDARYVRSRVNVVASELLRKVALDIMDIRRKEEYHIYWHISPTSLQVPQHISPLLAKGRCPALTKFE